MDGWASQPRPAWSPSTTATLSEISTPTKQDRDASKLEQAEEVVGLALEASDQPPEVLWPRKQALYPPSTTGSAQLATILSEVFARWIVGSDPVDAQRRELCVEPVAVVSLVPDQPFRQPSDESLRERFVHELDLISLTTRHPDGDRKTIAVCHCHDLGRFAASSPPNESAPVFAPA